MRTAAEHGEAGEVKRLAGMVTDKIGGAQLVSDMTMTIGASFSDRRLFGEWFAGESWDNWRAGITGHVR